jgi:hypothetical protein
MLRALMFWFTVLGIAALGWYTICSMFVELIHAAVR